MNIITPIVGKFALIDKMRYNSKILVSRKSSMKENLQAKLWQIRMERAGETTRLYVVSIHKPMLVFESYFGRLRRRFEIAPSKKQDPPVFYLLAGEKAEVERATDMHGFKLKAITEHHIILEVKNLENKNLYEISLFNPRLRGFWRREYIFSKDKREATSFAQQFKEDYHVSIKKASKIDGYRVEAVEKDRIILTRQA